MPRTRIAVAAIAATLAVALSACTPSPQPPVAQTPTQSPTTPPSTAPVEPEQTASADVWEISPDGIGPILLGASLEEVAAQYGAELADPWAAAGGSACLWTRLEFEGRRSMIDIAGTEGVIQRISLLPPAGSGATRVDPEGQQERTTDGVAAGTSIADVESLWGPANEPTWGPGGNRTWARVGDDPDHVALFMTNIGAADDPAKQGWVQTAIVHDQGLDGFPACYD